MLYILRIKKIAGLVIIYALTVALILAVLVYFTSRNDKVQPVTNAETSTTTTTVPTTTEKMTIADIETGSISLHSRAYENYFYVKKDEVWEKTFLKGVNVGLSLPTSSLDSVNISYSVYMDWFNDIYNMNANTIKVFSIMNPEFYSALFAFNKTHSTKPLYLIQGIWINENDMATIGDAFGENSKIVNNFKKTIKETIDVVNGNITTPAYGTVPKAAYIKDVSEYIVGFVLGLEWNPNFIINTNKNNPKKNVYSGKYLKTKNAAPFEAFLCEVGDYLIGYESDKYSEQQPVAFLNYSTTDVLKHTNEPFPEEDSVSLNTENIISTSEFYAGLFAAIDIYPYYPEFLNHQQEYINYRENGKANPYKAYLKDLYKEYTVPVIVAEFGIPTSRGKAHDSVMGYNQGFIDEVTQGNMVLSMMKDIVSANYAGAMIFSWQDEWFKQTWNTYRYSAPSVLQRASNVQSAEQFYGIAAYDPGVRTSVCYPDGDLAEWVNDLPVFSSGEMDLFIKNDERYLYIAGKMNGSVDLNSNKLELAIGTTGRGNKSDKENGISFSSPTDFTIKLDGKDNSRITVDASYDYFYYNYSVVKGVFARKAAYEKNNSGLFNTINMFYSNEMVLPVDKVTLPSKYFETGKLTFGNANPNSRDYYSLADFYFNNNSFEIRIPWYLINFIDPANKLIVGDLYKNKGIKLVDNTSFYIGGAVLGKSKTIHLSEYNLSGYDTATFHKRLKKSYNILKDGLSSIN